jgi:RibD C-terminal domain
MADTEPQTAGGKVLWHFTMSLDGFVAGPNHAMNWVYGISSSPGLVEEYVEMTGRCWEVGMALMPIPMSASSTAARGRGRCSSSPIIPKTPAKDVTFLSCDVAAAVRIGLEAAGGKYLEVFSPTIGRQLLERGLIDEIDLHIAPVLLGDGIRLLDNPGGAPIRLELLNSDDPSAAVNVRTTRSRPSRSKQAASPDGS